MGVLLLTREGLWGEQAQPVSESGAWKMCIQHFPLKTLLLDFLGDFGPSRHHSSLQFSNRKVNLTKQVVRLNIFGVLMSREIWSHPVCRLLLLPTWYGFVSLALLKN